MQVLGVHVDVGPGGMTMSHTECTRADNPLPRMAWLPADAPTQGCKVGKRDVNGGTVRWSWDCATTKASVHSEGVLHYHGGTLDGEYTVRTSLPGRSEMTAVGADGYLVIAQARTDAMRDAIAALALRHRLLGVAPMRRYAEAGVLLSYGASLSAIHRREAYFVDRILKGANPADLPVEQPTSFELVNLKTAKALGLTIPPLILVRADEVIE
jgi:putative ABC transport system substrate-binding protein